MKPTLCGRADLIRALALRDSHVTDQMAALLGYEETQIFPHPPISPERTPQTGRPTLEHTTYAPADVPFWRLDAHEAVVVDEPPPEPKPVPKAALEWQGRPRVVPGFTPLASKQAVLTRLRQLAVIRRVIPEVDVEKVVDRISRGILLSDIPRRERRSWGAALHIIEDRARRLVPYWLDQEYVTAALCRLYPPHGVTVARLDDGDSQPYVRWPVEQAGLYTPPPPGTMVFVLGDLGCLAPQNQHLQRFWLNYGRRLQDNHNPTVALVPVRIRDIPLVLARIWTLVRWDAMSDAAEVPSEATETALERLLTLVSPAVRLEPGLLRAMRCLMPEGRHDPGLEARVWQDEAITSQHSVAATLEPERRKAYQQHFAHLPKDLRHLALDLVKKWRAALNEAVWFEEIGELDADSQQELIDPKDLQDAERFFASMIEWVSTHETLPADIAACFSRMTGRFSPAATHNPVIRRAFHVMLQRIRPPETVVDVPAWYDPADLPSTGGSVRKVELWQVADQLCLQTAASSVLDNLDPVDKGSRLGLLETASGEVTLALEPPAPARLPQAWTNGIDMEFVLIPAGTFLMGSLEDEDGRYHDEGPQHPVRISEPFYLAKYAVTQAQWQRIMGNNPSVFKGANRPVETVSWEDAQAFIEQLNRLEGTQQYRLPTEAQWEYACRAGTQGARYHEDLDAIAWYDENSDDETHEVGQKAPNCWGLYDMLGNVDEWCHDGMREYTDVPVVDPIGPTEAGADRVFRGGCWGWLAQYVRAAVRLAFPPGLRDRHLGFRCASSVSQVREARATLSGLERQAEPAETAKRLPAARSVYIQGEATLHTALPQGHQFTIKTDRERLRFRQITKPSWASEIGRDVYGLWVRLEVDGVQQRMRWIPPGRFWMGSAADDPEAFESEQPRHQVHITRGFWLFDTPCTQEVWLAVMVGRNPSHFKGSKRPVEQVSWHDCQMFIQRMNERFAGLALALPTEAQWEYACRAGTQEARYHEDLDAIAWYGENSDNETHEVGQKVPNRWGLYDMLGNVAEWCHDGEREYTDALAVDPVGPTEAGAVRVFRGGGWDWDARVVRAAYRDAFPPGVRLHFLGFRCASSG